MPAAGGQATRLTSDKGDDRDPAWSPDGSHLALASDRTGQLQIYTMKTDGSDQRKVTNFAKGAEHPSWGPASATGDAATIAFAAYTGNAQAGAAAEIYEIRADGSEQRRLTDNSVEDSDPAWMVPAGAVALAPTPGRTPLPAPTAAAPAAGATASPVPAAVASNEILVDDQSPQFTRGGTARYWKEAPVGYADHMYFTYSSAVLDNWGRWTPKLPQAGTYEVFVHIPAQNATTQKASYTIVHAGKRDKQVINQMLYENAWLSLGTFDFSAKGGEYVQLGDLTGEAKSTKRIGFDAVKWVHKAP